MLYKNNANSLLLEKSFFLTVVLQAHLSFLRQYSSNYQREQSKFKQIQIKKIGGKKN